MIRNCLKKIKETDRRTLLIIIILFLFAFSTRVIDIDRPYETWDEVTTYSVGLNLWFNVANLDFSLDSWSISPHPPFARYVYGVINGGYVFSQTGTAILKMSYTDAVRTMFELENYAPGRTLSALLAAGTTLLIFIITRRYFGMKTAVLSSFIFILLPASIAQTKLAALDALLVFLFSLSVYFFMKTKENKKYFYLSAIVTGLAILTKFNAFSLFLLLPFIAYFDKMKITKKDALIYVVISAVFVFILWPRIWWMIMDPGLFFENLSFWTNYSNINEFFLGSGYHPFYYAPTYVFVTLPVIMIVFTLFGIYSAYKKKDGMVFNAWFLVPLIAFMIFQLLSPSAISQGGPRYVFMIYPGLSILISIGIFYVADILKKRFDYSWDLIIPVLSIVYLIIIAILVHPFYIDYYNEAVGGPKNVYENNLFAIGQWGEGIGDGAKYVYSVAEEGSSVQFFVMPRHVIPPLREDMIDATPYIPKYMSDTGEHQNWYMTDVIAEADYIVENTFFRIHLNETFHELIQNDYELIRIVEVQGAPLAWVYKKN